METKELKQKIEDFNNLQRMIYDEVKMEIMLADDGKAYVVKACEDDIVPDWISGYLCGGTVYNSLEEISDYYGVKLEDLYNDNITKCVEEIATIFYEGKECVMGIEELCSKLEIDYDTCLNMMKDNPSWTRDMVIVNLCPLAAINIFGKLIYCKD